MTSWLLLHYKLAPHPSAPRVYVWRKLKRLGAILLQEAVWILPDNPRTAEQLQWLAAEIQEMRGETCLWRADLLLGIPEEALAGRFVKQVDQNYRLLLRKLGGKNPDLPALSRAYQQIAAQDHFHSRLGDQVREKLLALRGAGR
jgi:hypothetical protein